MSIDILIADDHEVVRAGLKSLIEGTDIRIVAEATSGTAALKLAMKHRPDLVLLEVRMPDGDGLNCLARIKLDLPEIAGRDVQLVRQSDVRRSSRCSRRGRLYFRRAPVATRSSRRFKWPQRARAFGRARSCAASRVPLPPRGMVPTAMCRSPSAKAKCSSS